MDWSQVEVEEAAAVAAECAAHPEPDSYAARRMAEWAAEDAARAAAAEVSEEVED